MAHDGNQPCMSGNWMDLPQVGVPKRLCAFEANGESKEKMHPTTHFAEALVIVFGWHATLAAWAVMLCDNCIRFGGWRE